MGNSSRTFKLRLSPAGVDILIECHCHLIRTTRRLLPGGTTLQVALDYLDRLPPPVVLAQLEGIVDGTLTGEEEFFFWAPRSTSDVAIRIVDRLKNFAPCHTSPLLMHIYIAALQQLASADSRIVTDAYNRLPAE